MPLRCERSFAKKVERKKINKNNLSMDLKALNAAMQQIAGEKSITPEQVLNAIETAIAAAYKKE